MAGTTAAAVEVEAREGVAAEAKETAAAVAAARTRLYLGNAEKVKVICRQVISFFRNGTEFILTNFLIVLRIMIQSSEDFNHPVKKKKITENKTNADS